MEEESFGAEQAEEASANTLNGELRSTMSELESLQEDRPFRCNQCDKSYRHAGSLVNHKKTHEVGLYTCLICQKAFSNPMGLKSHLRTHSEEKRFKCEQCGEAFRMSQQLYNHRRSSHGFYSGSNAEKLGRSHKVNVQSPSLMESSNLMTNLENYIAESMVPVDFSQLVTKYYQEEMSQSQEVVTDDSETPQLAAEPPTGEPTVNDGTDGTEEYRYKCNQCDKAYKHAGSLANHKQTHMVGVYQCAICFKEFSNLMAMKNHCRLHSDSRARQRCRSPRSSGKVGGLSLGITDTLQSDVLHSSDFIGKYEDPPGVLQGTGNQNYVEDNKNLIPPSSPHPDVLQTDSFCSETVLQSTSQDSTVQVVQEYSVATSSALPILGPTSDQHTEEQQCNGALEEAKSGDLEDRPFKCQECGKSYRHAGSLINHKKTHQTGVYSCSLCSKQMFNAAALKNHFRAHFKSRPGRRMDDNYFHSASFSDFFQNSEAPLQCAICGDFFTKESDFLQHQELHKEEAIQETCSDTQNLEETSESIGPDNSHMSQVNSGCSYSNAPSTSSVVKSEVEDLADQQTPNRLTPISISPPKTKAENSYADCRSPPNDFSQLAQAETISNEEKESSGLGEHTLPVDRPYRCEACGKTYRHKSSLINHKLTHKTGIYQCSLCPKQYSNLMALRNHLRFHSRSYAGRRGIFSRRTSLFFRGRPRFMQNKTVPSSVVSVKLKDEPLQNNTLDLTPVESLTQHSCGCGDTFDCKEMFESHSQVCKNSNGVPGSEDLRVDLKQEESPMTDPQDDCKTPEKGGSQENVLEASEHQSRRVYECDLCDKSYRHSGSLINHKRTHQVGDYMCPYCSRHVHNMAALKNHIRIHHKLKRGHLGDEGDNSRFFYPDLYFPHADNRNMFGCPRCEEIFNSEDDLVAHQMVHMALEGDPWEQEVHHSRSPDKDLCRETTKGSEWGHSSSSDLHGVENLGKKDFGSSGDGSPIDYTCVECGEVYNSIDDLNNHKLTHQIGIYQCSFCPKEYPSLSALRCHFQSHTNTQVLRNTRKEISERSERNGIVEDPAPMGSSYDCGRCGLAFSNEVDFHRHQVSHEKRVTDESLPSVHREGKEPELTFSMDSSERELLKSIKSELEEAEHTTSDGASQLSHICGFCGKTYDDLESLQAHSRTHCTKEPSTPTNEDFNTETDIADNAVEKTQALDEEENTCNSKNEESFESRPFTCEQCGKSYRHGGSLVNHRKTHLVGNFQCFACFRHYPNMAAYRNHLRLHPDCKQSASVSSQPELQASDLQDSLHWNISPPGIGPMSVPATASVLPGDFKPCVDTLSTDHSNTQMNFQMQISHGRNARRRFLRKNKIRNEVVASSRFKGRSTSIKDRFEAADKSINVKDPPMHISGNRKKNGHVEDLTPIPSAEDIRVRPYQYLPNSISLNEVGTGFQQRPFRCEVCGRSYRHAGSLINHKQTHKTGIFRCSICQKRFFNLMAMKNHNRIHFELKRHACLDCGKAFRLRKQLETHQRIHWKKAIVRKFGRRNRRGTRFRKFAVQQKKSTSLFDDHSNDHLAVEQDGTVGEMSFDSSVKIKRDPASRPYQCQECGRSYRHAGSLCNHKKSHKTGQYSCSVCQRTYSNLMAMKNHERIHYDAKRHHCSQCGKTFKWKRQLTKHKLLHAKSQSGSQPVLGIQEARGMDGRRGKRSSTLGKRPKKTSSPVTTDSHGSSTTEALCMACGVSFSSYRGLKTHTCSQNSIKMPDSGTVGAHKTVLSKVDEERPFRCELCGRTYRHAGSLVNHKKTHKKGLYKCSLCSKQFFNSLAIKNHLSTHKAQKKFCCVECGKAFRSSRQLACHSRKHTGVGPFRCPICNCDFSSKVTLKHHQRTHIESETIPSQSSTQNQTDICNSNLSDSCESEPTLVSPSTRGVRKYKCNQCDRSYLHAGSLFNHQKTHKVGVYKCTDCVKEFFNLLAFKNHLRIHKFPCEDCGKAFRIASHLAAHRKVHDQEGSFICTLCNKRFSTQSSFERHQMTHNGQASDLLEHQPLSSLMVEVT